MAFVKRDAAGDIIWVSADPVEAGLEELPADHEDLVRFLGRAQLVKGVLADWLESDLALARVLEDLVEILIHRKVVAFTDFPEPAQRKLLQRRSLRKEFTYVDSLYTKEDEKFGDVADEGPSESLV